MLPADDHPRPAAAYRPRDRASMEERLLPLVRRALRSRIGLPALVGWVHRSAAALDGGSQRDADRTARGLTRLLCDLLLHPETPANPRAAETVRGPGPGSSVRGERRGDLHARPSGPPRVRRH
jgi:hypothetical protein